MYDVEQTYTVVVVYHPPMDTGNPKTDLRTLHEAGLLLGGERNLAEFLDIEEWLVSRWLEGLGHPPEFILSRCTDLIESRKPAGIGTTERGEVYRGLV